MALKPQLLMPNSVTTGPDDSSWGPGANCVIIMEALDRYETTLRKNRVEIEFDLPEDIPMIHGRSQQLEQVSINLVSNARYALNARFPDPNAENSLIIHAIPLTDDKMVRANIEDRGTGAGEFLRRHQF